MNKNGILCRYPWLLNPRDLLLNLHKLPVLFTETWRQGKLTELLSFAVWEMMYKTGLYKKKYVRFTETEPYVVTDNFQEELTRFLTERYVVIEAEVNWKILAKEDSLTVGATHESNNTLICVDRETGCQVLLHAFESEICALFICSSKTLLVCLTNGEVFKTGPDYFEAIKNFEQPGFEKCLELSNTQSSVRRKYAITETPHKTLLIGEYGNILNAEERWVNCAYFYVSANQGVTWNRSDFLIKNGINKHIHIIYYSELLNAIVMADGDNKKKLWIGETDTEDETSIHWRLINKYHFQTGGYISIAETGNELFFGSDYLGGTNFIIQTRDGRSFKKQVIPSPYRRCPVQELQVRSSDFSRNQTEIWALMYNPFAQFTKSLLMVSGDNGKSWDRMIEYDASKYEISITSNYKDCREELCITIQKAGTGTSPNNIKSYILKDSGALQMLFLQAISYVAVL